MTREDAVKVLNALWKYKNCGFSEKKIREALDMAIKALDKEQKKGSWIKFKEFENGYYHIKCSNCGQYWSIDGHAKCFKYCFNCGAKMEVKNETTK